MHSILSSLYSMFSVLGWTLALLVGTLLVVTQFPRIYRRFATYVNALENAAGWCLIVMAATLVFYVIVGLAAAIGGDINAH